MSNTKTNTHTSIGFYFMSLDQEVGPVFFQIRIEIIRTANDIAITSAMWNIAHASTKQNYIV